jgi:protein-S-isoprenylcysteine O-methyltransferase Ste14
MEALFISTEEENLEKAFGKEYRDYKRRVRRWV